MHAKKFAGIVNNAGQLLFSPWEELNYDDWDRTLAVNLTAPLVIMQKLGAQVTNGGAIVNISSTDAHVAAFSTIPYAASKFALLSITKSAATLLGTKGIRVNAVVPGWIQTSMANAMP